MRASGDGQIYSIRRNWAGTTGCMVPVDVSQVSKFPERGRETYLSFKKFGPDRSSDSSE